MCVWWPFSSTQPQMFRPVFQLWNDPYFYTVPPPAALPLPWPVPKGSSAHGCQVSCILLKKHGTDVRGPKTMLDSSKQTCTCSHSECHGCIAQARQFIWAANWTTSPVVCLPKSAWLLYPCWEGFLGPVVRAQHRKADLTLWLTHLPHDSTNANDKIKLWWSWLISKIIESSLSRHCVLSRMYFLDYSIVVIITVLS